MWYSIEQADLGDYIDKDGKRFALYEGDFIVCKRDGKYCRNEACGGKEAESKEEAAILFEITYDPLPEPSPETEKEEISPE